MDRATLPNDPQADFVRKVLIVGGGSAGWMAAAMLSRVLGPATEIELVESEDVGIVGVGEATIPPLRKFNQFCGVDESAFLRDTQGTFKVGIEFENWGKIGDRYLHAFGRVGQELDAVVRMHHWWNLGRIAGGENYPEWQDLFLGRSAMDLQRFGFGANEQDVSALLPHAYHFDAVAYGQHLRRLSESRGVKRTEGKIVSVSKDGESGNVQDVTLDDGRRISAELFIDCTGFRSLLLGDAMEEEFDDWSHWLPSDRAVVVQSESDSNEILPATRSIAQPVGWQWRIPLQNRIGNGHVYSSSFCDDAEAESQLLANIEGNALSEPRILRFKTGRRQRPWVGNVVGLGLSAGFLEPLESTSIHLVHAGLERLVELFPTRNMPPLLRNRFNEQSEREWNQVRDFIIAHYKVTQRDDSEFWRYTREMQVPDSLSEILSLWKENGTLAVDGGHLFQLGSWAAILIGQNLLPNNVHPLAVRVDPSQIVPRIQQLSQALRKRAETLPNHAAFVSRMGAAGKSAAD